MQNSNSSSEPGSAKEESSSTTSEKGRLVAKQFTVDGEIDIWRKDNINTPDPLAVEPLHMPLPKYFRKKHADHLWAMWTLIQQVKALPRRKIPVIRDECLNAGMRKQIIRELEDMGFLKTRILKIVEARSPSKSVGGRACVYPTTQGRAYFREVIEAAAKGDKNVLDQISSDPKV